MISPRAKFKETLMMSEQTNDSTTESKADDFAPKSSRFELREQVSKADDPDKGNLTFWVLTYVVQPRLHKVDHFVAHFMQKLGKHGFEV